MKQFLSNTKENWILKTVLLTYLLFIVSMFFISKETMRESSRNSGDLPFFLMFIFVITFAPITEEFIFRGFFIKKNWIRLLICIIFPFFLYFYIKDNYGIAVKSILLVCSIILSVLSFYNNRNYNKYFFIFIVILSATLFSLAHYQGSDFMQFNTAIFALSQFAFGLLSTWVIVNFGIFKSILMHVLHNFILISIAFFGYQFVDESINLIENNDVKVEWQQVAILNSNSSNVTRAKNQLKIQNLNLKDAIKFIIIEDSLKSKIKINDFYYKYNITITSKTEKLENDEIIKVFSKISSKNDD